MARWHHIEGSGLVVVADDGTVELVVSDEVAHLLDRASLGGLSTESVILHLIKEAEHAKIAERADAGTDPQRPVPMVSPGAGLPTPCGWRGDGGRRMGLAGPRAWCDRDLRPLRPSVEDHLGDEDCDCASLAIVARRRDFN